ncbi:MAG: bifunctional isocitrate dehydrogenase kinase/phosphatase [Pseudomonadota bacterium]
MNASPALTAETIAGQILARFALYRVDFQQRTAQARARFQDADWHGIQRLGRARLSLYHEHLEEIVARLTELGLATVDDNQRQTLWRAAKGQYRSALAQRPDWELGETFYNSVYRRFNGSEALARDALFVDTSFSTPPAVADDSPTTLLKRFTEGSDWAALLRQLLAGLPLSLPWQDFDRDIRSLVDALPRECPGLRTDEPLHAEVLEPLFFRNKGAYAIGRLRQGEHQWPLALPLLQDELQRLYVDTLVCDADELSIMFSFTRAYFFVDTSYPQPLIDFLAELLPNKMRWELYTAVGLNKHGKTEFYRSFLDHLEHSTDRFIPARGIKGMVMTVFTLPSFNTVFKLIKDKFAPQKAVTREEVKEKYRIVKNHDRVGRMADTQEFNNISFPRDRFTDELIEELTSTAGSVVHVTDEHVHIAHLYTERLMTPLNLYIAECSDDELRSALDEYGNAIRQLAAANIFPGDMLLKNFGVTRHGRVVFYDYDEISYLEDMNFRYIPEPRTPEEEMSDEVWYSVGPNDVFPEEFRKFLFGRRTIKALFAELHGELFDADYWTSLKEDIEAGEIRDVFPYRRSKRFQPDAETP